MRIRKRSIFVGLAAVIAAGVGSVYATSGSAGQRVVPSVLPEMAVFNDERRAVAPEPELATTFAAPTDKANMARTRLLGEGLGRFGSRVVAFPSTTGSSVCYALLGRTPHDPGMSYCYQPLASDVPRSLAGQHFHAAALYSDIDGQRGVQLFGIAFDDVASIRVDVAGTWHPVPVHDNGFYLDLPNVAQEDVGIVEATLEDGTTQRHDIQQGG